MNGEQGQVCTRTGDEPVVIAGSSVRHAIVIRKRVGPVLATTADNGRPSTADRRWGGFRPWIRSPDGRGRRSGRRRARGRARRCPGRRAPETRREVRDGGEP